MPNPIESSVRNRAFYENISKKIQKAQAYEDWKSGITWWNRLGSKTKRTNEEQLKK